MAGITKRTLHYYDEIGLLKPHRISNNRYRAYDDNDVLKLQQIMLYKHLGFELTEIKEIIGNNNFNIISSLEKQEKKIRQEVAKNQTILDTIKQTKLFITGKRMSNQALFTGLNDQQLKKMQKEAEEQYDTQTVQESYAKWNSYSSKKQQDIINEGNEIYSQFVTAIEHGPDSLDAQACVAKWRNHMNYFWTPSLSQLNAIAKGYVDDPRFRKKFDNIDNRLAEFVSKAVEIYIQNQNNKAD